MTERQRRALWVAGIIAAFIIGFLLGRRFCRLNGSATSDAGQVVGGGGGGGGGAKVHEGPGSAKGKVSSNPANGHSGADTDTVGTDATGSGTAAIDIGGGNGNGGGDLPSGDSMKKAPKMVDTLNAGFVAHLSGDLATGDKTPLSSPPDARVKTKTADDFSLDATGLPRYPMDVKKAFSSISVRTDKPADSGTAAVFVTSDSYDSVTSWYHTHMPPGARETNIDVSQLRQLASQLTTKNLLKMLGAQSAQPSAPDTTPAQPADTTGNGSRLYGWQIPDDGVHGERSVMVTSSPGKPTTVTISRSKRP